MDLKIFKQNPINIDMAGISSGGLAAADTSVSIFQKINAQIKSTETENNSKQEEPIKSKDGNYSFTINKINDKESVITFKNSAQNTESDIKLSNFSVEAIETLKTTLKQANDDVLGDLCCEVKNINYDPDLHTRESADGQYNSATDDIKLDNLNLETLVHELGHAVSYRYVGENNIFPGDIITAPFRSMFETINDKNEIKQVQKQEQEQDFFEKGLTRFKNEGKTPFLFTDKDKNLPGTYATANQRECYAEAYTLLHTGKCQSRYTLLEYFPEKILDVQRDIEKTRELSPKIRNKSNNFDTPPKYITKNKIVTEMSNDENGNPLKIETLKLDDITIIVKTDKFGRTSTNVESKEKFKNTDEKVKSDGIITTSYYRDFNENLTTKTRHQDNFTFENKDLVETILDNTTIKYPDGEETTNTLVKTKYKDGHSDVSDFEKNTCSNGEIKESNSIKSTFNDGHIETNKYTKITDKNGQEIIKGTAESTLPDGSLNISNYEIITDQSKKGKVNSSSKSIFKDGHSEIQEQEGTIDPQGKLTITSEKKYTIPANSELKSVK